MQRIRYTCKCSRLGEYSIRYNLSRVIDEVLEFVTHPSKDEGSDVMMNISTLLHAVIPAWVWLLPGASIAQSKGLARYVDHGCCRSARHSCNRR
jgi:hypothetical protein